MIADILGDRMGAFLVLDVSRWDRFRMRTSPLITNFSVGPQGREWCTAERPTLSRSIKSCTRPTELVASARLAAKGQS
jgi:hypothetical protein